MIIITPTHAWRCLSPLRVQNHRISYLGSLRGLDCAYARACTCLSLRVRPLAAVMVVNATSFRLVHDAAPFRRRHCKRLSFC